MRVNNSWVAIVFFLTRAPRFTDELVGLTGAFDHTVRRQLRLLELEGLVKREKNSRGANDHNRDLWTWTP